jgi:transcriptional regulator with XRE-family HTH domain
MSEFRRAFGLAVRLVRTRRGWTQSQLDKGAGLASGHVGRIERGEVDPNLSTQEKIAAALGVSLAELIAQAEDERERRRKRLGLGNREDPLDTS